MDKSIFDQSDFDQNESDHTAGLTHLRELADKIHDLQTLLLLNGLQVEDSRVTNAKLLQKAKELKTENDKRKREREAASKENRDTQRDHFNSAHKSL